MRRHLPRVTAAVAALATASSMALGWSGAAGAATPDLTITEWMYNPVNSSGEFIEITNLGDSPVSLAGWSFDDDSRTAGTVPLDGLGTLAAGESAIITESSAATFRGEWDLDAGVKILEGNTVGLGRADEINLFDGTELADRLTYDDQGTGAVKGPRTQGVSGVPKTEAALGANEAAQWRLSAVGDDEGSWASTGGDIGSPGTSRFAGDGGGDGDDDDPADWTAVHINEVSSDNDDTPVGDAIELHNSGDADVSITGWLQIDSGAASGAKTFQAKLADGSDTTTIPAHGYVYFASTKGLGSGGDGVNLYLPDGPSGTAGTLVDSVTYTAGEAGSDEDHDFGAGSFARCPDGSGDFVSVSDKSFGASNAAACEAPLTNPGDGGGPTLECQPEAPEGTGVLPGGALTPTAWPGSDSVTVADQQCAWMTSTGPEGRDISGLVFDPSDSGVLYAVKNKSWVFRLVKSGGLWVPDTSNGWGAGKQIFFPGNSETSTNQPDTEGLTVGGDGALYITTERNNQANTVPLNSVLRFDPEQPGSQLVATEQWDLTADFPELHPGSKTEANLGFEGIAFVPDGYLTAHGFVDDSAGRTYRPADYPQHGGGLHFAALENDGKLYAYALGSDGSAHRVSVVDTGMGHVMDVLYDADHQRIWALCDNTCGVVSTVLKVSSDGSIVPEASYARPTSLPDVNIEGFALAPSSTCVDGTKEAVWSDDGLWAGGPGSEGYGHALYSGRVDCDLGLGEQGVPAPAGPQEPGDQDTKDKIRVLPDATFTVGETIRVDVGDEHAGADVTAWLFSDPLRLGSFTVGADGIISFVVPTSAPTGQHRLAVYDAAGDLIGWQNVTVLPAGAGGLGQSGSGLGSGGAQLPAAGASLSGYLVPTAIVMILLGLTMAIAGRGRRAGRLT